MADEIKDQFGVQAELIKGSGGIFDVVVDGKMIYSKHQTGRFPENDEVISTMEAMKK